VELGSAPKPAVGDYVALTVGGTEARIEQIGPRKSSIERKEAGIRAEPQVICANADVLLLVTTGPAGRDYSIRRIERYLATLDPAVTPIIVLNKADMEPDAPAVENATAAQIPGVRIVSTSATEGSGCKELLEIIRNAGTVAIAGSSGCGKSTLIARLTGSEARTGSVRASDGRGRHTTTGRTMYALGGNSILVDTPGIREVQLWAGENSEQQLRGAFPEIAEIASECRFSDCTHHHEPGCAVLAAVQEGEILQDRYLSYLELRGELEHTAGRSEKQQRLNNRRAARKSRMKRRSRGG
jgi:ribosome biogenesis GTPase